MEQLEPFFPHHILAHINLQASAAALQVRKPSLPHQPVGNDPPSHPYVYLVCFEIGGCRPGVLLCQLSRGGRSPKFMTGRPLFRDETSFRALHAQRLPSYQLADFRVDSGRDPSIVVADILRLGIFPKADPDSHLLVEEPRS